MSQWPNVRVYASLWVHTVHICKMFMQNIERSVSIWKSFHSISHFTGNRGCKTIPAHKLIDENLNPVQRTWNSVLLFCRWKSIETKIVIVILLVSIFSGIKLVQNVLLKSQGRLLLFMYSAGPWLDNKHSVFNQTNRKRSWSHYTIESIAFNHTM